MGIAIYVAGSDTWSLSERIYSSPDDKKASDYFFV
jgi:hypothetical protein